MIARALHACLPLVGELLGIYIGLHARFRGRR
jgi:hypothetical protein